MKKIVIERRELLRWIAFSCPALGYLAGCSGGNGSPQALAATPITADPSSAQQFECSLALNCKVIAQLFQYSGQSLIPTKSDLLATLYDVTSTADRFNDGELCYQFNGATSLATAHNIANFPSGNLAISFWANSSHITHMQAVAVAAGNALLASIEFNNQCGLGILWGHLRSDSYRLKAGAVGEFTDGAWHHFLVQFDGSNISAFVDGVLKGEAPASALANAGDLFIGGGSAPAWYGAFDDLRLHSRAFDPTFIPQMVYAWAQVRPTTRNDSLLAYYPFNGNAVNDNGRGFDGTAFNVTPAQDRFGQAQRAYAFNGRDSYIELPTQLGPVAGDFCLAFWFQSSSNRVMTAFSLTKGIDPGAADLNFVFNAGNAMSAKLDGVTSTSIFFGSPGELSDGAWHFVLLQLAGATYQLYVDGLLRGTMQNGSSVLTSDSVIRFGRASGTSLAAEYFWEGSIDDVQVYATLNSSPFTQHDIAALVQLQFRPRDGAGALVFQNKMWLLGGWNPANAVPTNDQVWSSSDGSNWVFIGNAPWENRHMSGWLVYNDRMWVIGGDNNNGHYQNDVWSTVDGINWVEETDSVPWANRATQYTVAFKSLMWLMGGQQLGSATVPGAVYNDVYSSLDGISWKLVSPHAGWSPRGQIIGNVVFSGKMWVIGGGTYDLRTYLNDVWNSADGVHWTQITAAAPWTGRQFHNVAVFDNKIWVIAGGTPGEEGGSTDVWYSTDGAVWTNLAGTPWTERHAASVWVFQNALWFGNGSSAAVYNDIWKMTYAD
jgi:hypothetical protein